MPGVLSVVIACKICAKNGFADEQINLEKLGDDPTTGKAKWKSTNPDGTEHKHKGGQTFNKGYGKDQLEELKKQTALLERIASKLGS